MIDHTIEQALAPSKEDWREPLWAKFKAFCWGFGKAAALIALFLAGVALYQGYKNHSATVEAIQNPPSGSPEIGASPKNKGLGHGESHIPNKASKNATNKIANEALNTPAKASFDAKKIPVKKPKISDDFTADFDKQVINLESQL